MNYSNPQSTNISDVYYTRHNDIKYSFSLMSCLAVTQPLSTVCQRQEHRSSFGDLLVESLQ